MSNNLHTSQDLSLICLSLIPCILFRSQSCRLHLQIYAVCVHFSAHVVPIWTTPAASELVYVLSVLDTAGILLSQKMGTVLSCVPRQQTLRWRFVWKQFVKECSQESPEQEWGNEARKKRRQSNQAGSRSPGEGDLDLTHRRALAYRHHLKLPQSGARELGYWYCFYLSVICQGCSQGSYVHRQLSLWVCRKESILTTPQEIGMVVTFILLARKLKPRVFT